MQELELSASRTTEHARVRLLNTASPRHYRLARNLEHLVASDPDIESLEQDSTIVAMLQDHGFEERDVATAGVRVGDESFTILCVRQTRWNDPGFMERLKDLRSQALEAGRLAVLIPEAFVQRQPRFQNIKPVTRTARYRMTAKSRMRLLVNLVSRGPTPLVDCAALVDDPHHDPVEGILHLVDIGVIWMDLDRRLCLDGLIHLPGHERGVELSYGAAA